MLTTHVMVDIETVSKKNTAAILSIGAVAFDPNDATTPAQHSNEKFHVRCDLLNQERLLTIEGGTVEWWLHPDRAAAREQLNTMQKVDMPSALLGLSEWMDQLPGEKLAVWGNGNMFDNAILLNAYETHFLLPSSKWDYKADRDYRTMKALVDAPAPVDYGVAHGALDDAIAQANHLKAIVAKFGLTL